MNFFILNEPPSNYQIESRDRHASLIKTITGVSTQKANALSDCLQLGVMPRYEQKSASSQCEEL